MLGKSILWLRRTSIWPRRVTPTRILGSLDYQQDEQTVDCENNAVHEFEL
jgi:hypothetical protein